MYIVTSKPKRISVNSGLVHMAFLLSGFEAVLGSGVLHRTSASIVRIARPCGQRKSLIRAS
jgi:hypothetical protein